MKAARARASRALRALPLLAALWAAPLAAAPTWTGTWDTHWPGGGARVTLEQQGGTVSGAWEPGGGVMEGKVDGDALAGTWRDGSGSGAFRIQLSGDGRTFFGRFRIGDWWTGQRVERSAGARFAADRGSPRAVLRSFLIAANAVRNERLEYVRPAMDCLTPGPDQPPALSSRAGDHASLYYEMLDRATFRLSDVPDGNPGSPLVLSLPQAGTDENVEVVISRDPDGWRLVVPIPAAMRAALRRLDAARGVAPRDPLAHRHLEDPRSTMRTFLEQYARWEDGGRYDAVATLDLSGVRPAMRDVEAPLLAAYLKQSLDRVGYVIYQEIPDDPRRPLPYVHFRHPRGDIVLVRSVVDSVPGWRFSVRTMSSIRDLYEALEDVPLASRLIPEQRGAAYFGLNSFVRDRAPALTRLWLGMEVWQWLAVLVSLAAAALAGFGLDLALRRLARPRLHTQDAEARRRLRTRLLWPLLLALAIGIAYLGISNIGLPLKLLAVLHALALGTLVAAGAWSAYAGVALARDQLQRRAGHTRGFDDDLMISLVGSVLQIAVVVLGLVLLAREIGIPLGGILAGLGVGGVAVAMAAKDSVANLFGAAALIADRPFRRGDLVRIAGHEGRVHEVGLRSTVLRAESGALVSIPNSLMASTSIENLGRDARAAAPPAPPPAAGG
jgi:hypothetical protein